ncbi:hypothetical protein HHK36_004037 [Tetracentron sinense]|uniref:F-box domain-containing protein n=1 Tax=Tetracentron sinense TaxID=13715 RepID=A0A834ZQ56_TETSI|nr:hypothetical protein HHK36_004037 [Tetracentron sinense]
MHSPSESEQQIDCFDQIPDSLVLLIFNQVSDIKTLIRCGAVSKRFNSLVPQADHLLLKVDCVISTDTSDWFLLHLLRSIYRSLQDLVSPKRLPIQTRCRNSPTKILGGFENIRRLEVELPAGDLRLEKGAVLRWRAVFGRTLKSCVIFAVRTIGESTDEESGDEIDFYGDGGGGLKLRVVWTISALIAASVRHYLLKDVIRDHREIESLVLRDREGEGKVVMDKEGLKEFREGEEEQVSSTVGWKNRTTVPPVRMRMRHEPRLDLPGGVRMKGATLVVVRSTEEGIHHPTETEAEEQKEDAVIAVGSFGGVFGDAVEALLKSRIVLDYLVKLGERNAVKSWRDAPNYC